MKVSVIGSRYGKETAELLATSYHNANEVILGVPKKNGADIWVLTDWNKKLSFGFKEKIRPQDIVLLNSDDAVLLEHMAGLFCNTVTFGYHLKSTVTLSGMEEDVTNGWISYTFALQRPMLTYSGTALEPCEVRCSLPKATSPQSAMAAVAFFLAAEVAFFP